jgi:O-antigen/teichoic acid export membrane protein
MSISSMPEIEANTILTAPSEIERTAIRLLRLIPGFDGLSPSRRAVVAIRGGAWAMAGYGGGQLLRLMSTLILARMLAPQAFGLVALVNVFLSGLEMLSDLGIGLDVVQHRRGDDPSFVNTAFLIQAGRGIILWVLATALAYPFAHFYHQPVVTSLVIVGSISVLIRGLTSGSIWSLTRHVQLGKLTMLTTGSDFFGFLIALTWAFVSPTAWALVVGRIAAVVAFTAVSHFIADHPLSMKWDPKAAREILAFGAGIFLSTATYFLGGEAERMVVGKFVTLAELGCFSLALSISSAAAKGLQQVVSQVFFPMMSASIRDNPDGAVRDFKKMRHLLLIVSTCLSLGFLAGSNWLVMLLLGPKYAMAGWMLQLLGLRGALELFMSGTASMLFALGISRYAAIGNIFKLTFLGVGLAIAFSRFGFREALWVLTLAPIANYIPLVLGLRRHLLPALRTELASGSGFAAISLLTAALVRVI